MPRRNRSLIAQFQSGILPLYVETRRYVNVPLDQRFCINCNLNVVEDEFHLLCVCPLYENLRQEMFNSIENHDNDFRNLDIFDKFIYISNRSQKYLGIFLHKAMNLRQQNMSIGIL